MSSTTQTARELDPPDQDAPDQQPVGPDHGSPDGGTAGPEPTSGADDDVREQIEAGVLFANGRLAGRRFASLAEAQAWAHPELGDQVVEFNPVCDCSV